jgi:predicted 3-demethylubiquinone-9 3-methyltransferase (glyoxalase superfamily)
MRNPFPCLWFDGKAEDAATFYTSLLPDSSVDKVWRSPADTPSGPAGMVLTVDFTLNGQHFQALNGGPDFSFNEAVSFVIECEDQDEVDRLWDALTADGGEPGPVRMAQRPIRDVVADRSAPAERTRWRSRSGACAPRHGGDAQDGQDRCRRAPAGGERPRGVSSG